MENDRPTKGKTGPRGGAHTEEAKQKMRDKWAERKALLEFAVKVKEATTALIG